MRRDFRKKALSVIEEGKSAYLTSVRYSIRQREFYKNQSANLWYPRKALGDFRPKLAVTGTKITQN